MNNHVISNYVLIPESQCLPIATACHNAATAWHIHVLTPGCLFNPFERYSVVIEDDAAGITYLTDSAEFPMVDRELVQLQHGDDILNPAAGAVATGVHISTPLLESTRGIANAGQPWHFHIHLPLCSFNPAPGKFAISVEYDGAFDFECWDDEPLDILREYELLFFDTQVPTHPNN